MAKKCNPSVNSGSLLWCAGQTAMPGIKKRVYYIPKSDIVQWPTMPKPDESVSNPAALATYIGNFTLAADKVWHVIEVNQMKSPIASEPEGEFPYKVYKDTGTFFYDGAEAEVSAFARLSINDDYVYIFEDMSGSRRVVGNETYKTETSTSIALGQQGGSEKGATIVAACSTPYPLPFYPGEIETEDGTIGGVAP